jgi:ribosomal protein S27AE
MLQSDRDLVLTRPSLAAFAARLLDAEWQTCPGCAELVIPVEAASGRSWRWTCPRCGWPGGDGR